MKAIWEYRCDFGHSWSVFRDEDAGELPEDAVCPFGHEAVTLHKSQLLNMVQVSLRPAARVVDSVTGRTGHEYEYFLVITDLHKGIERMSAKAFTWEAAKAAFDRFRIRPDSPGTASPDQAWQRMDEIDAE